MPVDYLANCTQLGPVADLLADVPEMTAVINHGGRPFVMTGELGQWRRDMRRIASSTSAYIKVSGLVERAGVEWRTDTLRPWVEAMLEDFGCNRLIFASNWPIMTLMSTYGLWWEAINEIVDKAGVSTTEVDIRREGVAGVIREMIAPRDMERDPIISLKCMGIVNPSRRERGAGGKRRRAFGDRSRAIGQSPKGGWSLQTPLAHKEKGPARDLFSGLRCASGGGDGPDVEPSLPRKILKYIQIVPQRFLVEHLRSSTVAEQWDLNRVRPLPERSKKARFCKNRW